MGKVTEKLDEDSTSFRTSRKIRSPLLSQVTTKTKNTTTIKTIRPAINNDQVTRFDIETEGGNFYMIEIKKKLMRVKKLIQNEYSGDWIEGEVSGGYIADEVKDMQFTNLVDGKAVSYRDMEALYVHMMFFIIA